MVPDAGNDAGISLADSRGVILELNSQGDKLTSSQDHTGNDGLILWRAISAQELGT